MRRVFSAGLAGLLVCSALACPNAEDQAAKERVFSPPPPDPVLEAAKQPVHLGNVANDRDYAAKVFSMLFPEVRARVGAGEFKCKHTMVLQRGQNLFKVEETGKITFNNAGDMAVELRTGPTEATQLIYANGVLFLRNRAGSWRASRDPSDERHFWADQTYAGLRTTLDLFKTRWKLLPKGPQTVGGRKGTRFDLTLEGPAQDPGVLPDEPDPITSVRLPDGGVQFRAAQDRRKALRNAQPQALSGTVVMDDDKGVPLSVKMEGTLKLPGRKTGDVSTMTLTLESTLVPTDKETPIHAPKEYLEEIVRRRTSANPLEFLDGGTTPAKGKADPKASKEPAEPADEGEE